jgi:hypothetical protein
VLSPSVSDSIDPWPSDAVLREMRRPPSIAEVARHVLASSPTPKTLEVFAWYATLRDSLDRISEEFFPPGSTVTHELIVQCMATAAMLRDQCFDYLEWIRTGYVGPSTPPHRFSNETLH